MSPGYNQRPDTPYKGLMPYAEEDAQFFFGREGEQEIIIANLMASRLTLLYGATGVGKSSVLRAGVAHHLRQLAQQNLAERGTPEFVVVVFSSWRDDPILALTARIQESVTQVLNVQTLEPVPPSRALAQTLQAWTERVGGDLLIILDQFEEYFLYHPQEDGEGTFAVEFPRAVNRPDLRVSFLISIREDALAKLDRFKGRIPNLFDNYLRIQHLDREAARAAIEKPLEQHNRLRGADDRQVSIEPALVEGVLDQVRTGQVVLGKGGRGVVGGEASPTSSEVQIEAPYLQLVMTRLWDEEMRTGSDILRLETLDRLEGSERIVRTHLDGVMSALPPSEQEAAARVFHHLVTPGGTKIAHTVPDLAEYSGLPQIQLTPMLDDLSGAGMRILRPVAPPLDQPLAPRYEIFHDVLGPAILDWRARYVQAQEQRRQRQRRMRVGVGAALAGFATVAVLIWRLDVLQKETRGLAEANRVLTANEELVAATVSSIARNPNQEISEKLQSLEALRVTGATEFPYLNAEIEVLQEIRKVVHDPNLTIREQLARLEALRKPRGKELGSLNAGIKRLKEIQRTSATIASEDDFITCSDSAGDSANAVEATCRAHLAKTFRVGSSVSVFAGVRAPRAEKLSLKWIGPSGDPVEETNLSVKQSSRYRTWRVESLRKTGPYEVRLYNQEGLLIGRKSFQITD